MSFADYRLWETNFQVFKALPSLPQPYVAVLERQCSPRYHIECRSYSPDTAMLRVTLEGEGVFRLGKQLFPLPPGKAYFIMDKTPEAAYYYPSHARKPWIFLWFGFKGACVPDMMRDLNARYGHVFDLPLDSGVVKYLESMESLKGTVQALSPTAGAKIVTDVLAGLGDVIERPQLERPDVTLAKNAQEMMLSSLKRKGGSISEIAGRLNVSREHLSRVFKEQTGQSPLDFMSDERMRLAMRILSGTRISCKELAGRLGYDSPSSFARAFKRRFGTSPGKRYGADA